MRRTGALAVGSIVIALVLFGSARTEAHKPITSPYTYNEDVFPILRDRCGACHVGDGVAPMSLMTHADAVPWGESIRAEVMAGHMPPWTVETSRTRFRNAGGLTARELNVLLTWVTGGTPLGDPAHNPAPMNPDARWPLGTPDVEFPLNPVTLAAETQELMQAFSIAPSSEPRRIRAIDLLPGTPAIVRSATISVLAPDATAGHANGISPEHVLARWLPGETGVAATRGAAFELPVGVPIVVTVRYKKTWQYERKEMLDRSRVGIYFADSDATRIDALTFDVPVSTPSANGAPNTVPLLPIERDLRALAIHTDTTHSDLRVKIEAARPDGSIAELIAFRPQPDWARRYWFAEPVALPKGTHINVTVSRDEEVGLQPPAPSSAQAGRANTSPIRVTLDVIPSP